MHILIFGTSGQLGQALHHALRDASHKVTQLGRSGADFAKPETLPAIIKQVQPDAVIIAAAYTAVDKAEEEQALAHLVNAAAPEQIAYTCRKQNIPLVHISTDFVFDGKADTPYTEDHPTNPLGVYGRSKLAGEQAIIDSGCRHAIVRTSWVFSEYGANFVKTMLRFAKTRDELSVVADQIGQPTCAHDLASTCIKLAEDLVATSQKPSGIYHYSGAGSVSWADFARAIFDQAGLATKVIDIPSSDYPTPAKRPAFSVMNCTKIATDYAIIAPDWRPALALVVTALGPNRSAHEGDRT